MRPLPFATGKTLGPDLIGILEKQTVLREKSCARL
jgi:hypothetical protein